VQKISNTLLFPRERRRKDGLPGGSVVRLPYRQVRIAEPRQSAHTEVELQ
jgi:hypothetical protein